MDGAQREWLNHELALVVENLSRSFSSLPPDDVRAAVESAEDLLAPQASVVVFLPILIQRRAREHLRRLARTDPPPG